MKSVPAIFGHANAGATLNFCGKADLQQIKTAADKLGMAFGLSTGPPTIELLIFILHLVPQIFLTHTNAHNSANTM